MSEQKQNENKYLKPSHKEFIADLIKLHKESPSSNLMECFLSKLNLEFIKIVSQLAAEFSLPLFKTHLFLTTYNPVSHEMEIRMNNFIESLPIFSLNQEIYQEFQSSSDQFKNNPKDKGEKKEIVCNPNVSPFGENSADIKAEFSEENEQYRSKEKSPKRNSKRNNDKKNINQNDCLKIFSSHFQKYCSIRCIKGKNSEPIPKFRSFQSFNKIINESNFSEIFENFVDFLKEEISFYQSGENGLIEKLIKKGYKSWTIHRMLHSFNHLILIKHYEENKYLTPLNEDIFDYETKNKKIKTTYSEKVKEILKIKNISEEQYFQALKTKENI